MFRMWKRLNFGEVLHINELTVSEGFTTVRLSVRRDRKDGEFFAVIELTSPSENSSQHLEPEELEELADAVQQTLAALKVARLSGSAKRTGVD